MHLFFPNLHIRFRFWASSKKKESCDLFLCISFSFFFCFVRGCISVTFCMNICEVRRREGGELAVSFYWFSCHFGLQIYGDAAAFNSSDQFNFMHFSFSSSPCFSFSFFLSSRYFDLDDDGDECPPSHPLKIFSHHLATQTNWVEEHSYRSNDGYPRAHLYQFVLRVLPF